MEPESSIAVVVESGDCMVMVMLGPICILAAAWLGISSMSIIMEPLVCIGPVVGPLEPTVGSLLFNTVMVKEDGGSEEPSAFMFIIIGV